VTSGDELDLALGPKSGLARVRVGVIGCGYWGPHLIRNLHEMTEADLLAVSDQRPDRLAYVADRYPGVELFADHRELLASGLEAVVIATPIHTHHALARDALMADRHVLVEKPLAASVAEAAELVRLARQRGLVLMAGHTFIYNPAVRELRRLVQQGDLGRIYYGDAARLNLGLFQRHANVLWDLAPHDISILMHVLNDEPVVVSARGSACVYAGVHDVCYLELQFTSGASAHIHVSWLDPDKVRRLTLVGDRRMAVFDDVSSTTKLRIYDRGVERPEVDNYGEFEVAYRHGEIVIPYITRREPLRLECEHFLECVLSGRRPLSDGEQGLAVVAALEAAERSLQGGGQRVRVEGPTSRQDATGPLEATAPHRNGGARTDGDA
jgi:predicted dehydrogenase